MKFSKDAEIVGLIVSFELIFASENFLRSWPYEDADSPLTSPKQGILRSPYKQYFVTSFNFCKGIS